MKSLRQIAALALACLLCFGSAYAGLLIRSGDGIQVTGADGIQVTGADGIQVTGADGILNFNVNGIQVTGADGIQTTGADGIQTTGADGIQVTGADGIQVTTADGIQVTGADGIQVTGADGTTYRADSVVFRRANGVSAGSSNAVTVIGVNGIQTTGADGIQITTADGIQVTGADGIQVTGADGVIVKTPDGRAFAASPDGIQVTGADGIQITGADGIQITGADTVTRTSGIPPVSASTGGLRSVDPELALTLDRMTDDSSVNAVLVYHRLPTDQDLADLQALGVIGGTRFRALPMIYVTATREQIIHISHLRAVRSIYGNRTLQFTADPARGATGVDRAGSDAELTRFNSGLPVTGRGVTVAVLDTGVDATHADLAGRVAQNVKLADLQSAPAGFDYPSNVENVPDTDQAHGHGTFVAGVIGGNGSRSAGQYTGVAPGARIVGLGAGDANLVFVLSGFDYLLERGASLGVRVVNCSFSAETVYDPNDPVNVATKMLFDRGVTSVFSAGNTGPGWRTLNPYAAAPWVVSVGAMEGGKLASFSSRGDFANPEARPTLVAPGVKVVGLRSTGVSQTGIEGVGFNSDTSLAPNLLPYYTTATGTSFSAPQVAGAVALMLEANPQLTPWQIKDILQRTATPLAPYYQHEVGAGMLNAHAAVLEAAFPARRMGRFRAAFDGRFFRAVADAPQVFTGTVNAGGGGYETTFSVPENSLFASMQIGWGPLWSLNDLGMALYDSAGARQADVNVLNLPGLAGHRERALITRPAAGAWRMTVKNTLGLAGTPQEFTGVLETAHAEYAALNDVSTLSAQQREDVYQSLRTFTLEPAGRNFRPSFSASRLDLAAALVIGGRVPQYVPASPTYHDVRDQATMLFVESAQRSPRGALFPGVAAGDSFSPNASVDRLTAAIALVRAAGLQAEADARAGDVLLGVSDASKIPTGMRGYVYVAVARGLLTTDQTGFRPQGSLTRLELAHAMAVLQSLLTQ
ncbi:MAG: S8 family serine peptidase [Acidobacteria bacterium]|nr:S8 family serine peptidase [Acidobacteriota bacterium]